MVTLTEKVCKNSTHVKYEKFDHHIVKTTERTRSKHRAGIASEASGQCEVVGKCERTLKLPPNAEMGAPRADASDGEKAGVKLAEMLNYTC